jgi:hypothetical protein
MGVVVRFRNELGATVVELDGPSDPDLLARVGEAIARIRVDDPSPLVLDVTGLAMAHPRGLAALVEQLGPVSGDRLRIVCRRLSGRRLVRRARIPALVFGSVANAIADAMGLNGAPPPVVVAPTVLDLSDASPATEAGTGPDAHVVPG